MHRRPASRQHFDLNGVRFHAFDAELYVETRADRPRVSVCVSRVNGLSINDGRKYAVTAS